MSRIAKFLVCFLILYCQSEQAFAQLAPPVPQTPLNGAVLELAENQQQSLSWSRVANATGYLLDVGGPEAFGVIDNAFINQDSNLFISFDLNGVVAGDYVWSVSAVNSSEIAAGTTSTFRVREDVGPGGPLDPPTPTFPPNLAFLKGGGTSVTFEWDSVPGADHYVLNLPGETPSQIEVSPGETRRSRFFRTQDSKIFKWSVAAVDATGTAGTASPLQTFLMTTVDFEADQLLFNLSGSWYTGDPDMNVVPDPAPPQGEAIVNAEEALALIPYQQDAKPRSIAGQNGPTLISPASGEPVPLEDDDGDLLLDTPFVWNFPEPDGFEFNLLDENMEVILINILPPEPETGNGSTRIRATIGTGDFFWRVRAFTNDASTATPYSVPRPVNIYNPFDP